MQMMVFHTLALKQICSHKFCATSFHVWSLLADLLALPFSMFPVCTPDCVGLRFSRYLLVSAQVGLHPEYRRSLRYLASADSSGRTLVLSECTADHERLCDGDTHYNYWTTLQVQIQGSY